MSHLHHIDRPDEISREFLEFLATHEIHLYYNDENATYEWSQHRVLNDGYKQELDAASGMLCESEAAHDAVVACGLYDHPAYRVIFSEEFDIGVGGPW